MVEAQKIKIERAGPDGSAQLAEILYKDQVIGENLRQMITEANAHYFQEPDTLIWFAYHGGIPVGMLWLILDSDRENMSNGVDLAELHQFRVVSDFRGQKVGSLLYKIVVDEAKRRSFKTLTLAVEKDNLSAQDIYSHWGFRPDGTRVDLFGVEEVESIRMVKSLIET